MEMGGGLRYDPHPSGSRRMLVRMLVDVSYTTGNLIGGVCYDVPPGDGEAMVIAGWAEKAEQPAPLRIVPAEEHAATLRQRREGVL